MVTKLAMLAAAAVAAADCTSQAMDPVRASGPAHYQDWSDFEVGYQFTTDWGAPPIEVVDPGLPGLSRALEIEYNRSGSHSGMPESGWDIPGAGESIYFRILLYQDLPASANGVDHGLQSNIGSILHYWMIANGSGESPSPDHFSLGFGSMPSGDLVLYNAALPKRTWLQVEWAIHREDDTRARAEIRVTDIERGTVWTGADWRNSYGAGQRSLAEYPLTINDASNLGSYRFGVSGSGLSGASVRVAALCTRLDDWCGPYVAGEGG